MAKCHICGKDFDNAAFCPDCGIKLETDTNAAAQTQSYTAGETSAPLDKPMGVWDFVLMELVSRIPVINIILYFVWGFSSSANVNRKNWSRAKLIWAAIGLVISIVITVLMLTVGIVTGFTTELIDWIFYQ